MIELQIKQTETGGRLDKYLCRYLDKAPKNFVYKMLRKKNIVLNDKKASGNEILQIGDRIRLYLADETIASFRSKNAVERSISEKTENARSHADGFSSRILFEDENLLVMNKPSGLLSQKAKAQDVSINEMMLSYLSDNGQINELFVPGICNRLDRNTSGIVFAGKNPAAARQLNQAVKERRIQKLYWTLVKGPVKDKASVEGYLIKDPKSNTVSILQDVSKAASDVRGASSLIKTAYRPLASGPDSVLLEVDLITGKTHQIRAHLASLGHPVAGDPKYGDPAYNRRLYECYRLRYQLLHAAIITFSGLEGHLSYLNEKSVQAPLPQLFAAVLKGEHIWLPGEAEDFAANSSKH